MSSVLRFILSSQLKHSRQFQQVGGFTLIELLVGMIMAFLIITPLLGFMINILDTDRKEQAKIHSEQEIQTALDYISRDLQQAVYIYDANGLNGDANSDPKLLGIKNQIPEGCDNKKNGNSCQPILVFWKREFIKDAVTVSSTTAVDKTDDTYVYSLVAYYLIKDDNPTWSKASRIARFQVKDGVQPTNGSTGDSCGADYPDEKYIKKPDKTIWCPDKGFKRFDITTKTGSLQDKMNTWTKASTNYEQNPLVLLDFIDQTTTTNPANATSCPSDITDIIKWSKVTPANMTSFYVCVDTTTNTTAQVFLRGNALARLQNDNLDYTDSKKTYFPTANIRVQKRGYLFTK